MIKFTIKNKASLIKIWNKRKNWNLKKTRNKGGSNKKERNKIERNRKKMENKKVKIEERK